jgi:hypothetical protein
MDERAKQAPKLFMHHTTSPMAALTLRAISTVTLGFLPRHRIEPSRVRRLFIDSDSYA